MNLYLGQYNIGCQYARVQHLINIKMLWMYKNTNKKNIKIKLKERAKIKYIGIEMDKLS